MAQKKYQYGFTLIELLVVVSIIALLIAILMPVLGRARHSAQVMQCLSNIRQMQIAQQAYMTDNKGLLIQANMSHGGILHNDDQGNPVTPWFYTLSTYSSEMIAARSPLDDSPHWGPAPAGEPIPSAPADQRRLSSYGINNFLVDGLTPWGGPYDTIDRIDNVTSPSNINQFLVMAYEGEFAGADHPHIENWLGSPAPAAFAARQVQTNHAGGPVGSPKSKSNWGYLDGHAATQTLDELLIDDTDNRFDPKYGNH